MLIGIIDWCEGPIRQLTIIIWNIVETFRNLYVELTSVLDSMSEAAELAGSEHQAKKLKEDPISYLENAPIAFRETSDCILRLDSGERLPVHK